MNCIVDPEDLETLRGDASLRVVDCRFDLADAGAGERAYRAGHVPGAVYAHLERDLSGTVVPGQTGRHPLPDPTRFAARLGGWGIGSTNRVVAYDAQAGAIAARFWWMLRWLGHDRVSVLNGGFKAWQEAGFSVSTEVAQPPPARFDAVVRPERVLDATDVDRIRERPDWRLLDARASDRFSGALEPIDPVAGHIPGARSAPFARNLRSGRFRTRTELQQLYAETLGGAPADQAVAYCGSGVTACHLILAAEAAGFSGMRLYAGSWSEWITDPRRPVATQD